VLERKPKREDAFHRVEGQAKRKTLAGASQRTPRFEGRFETRTKISSGTNRASEPARMPAYGT
jgi:hypothetical protein